MGLFAEMFGYTPAEYRALAYADFMRLRGYIDAKKRAEAHRG